MKRRIIKAIKSIFDIDVSKEVNIGIIIGDDNELIGFRRNEYKIRIYMNDTNFMNNYSNSNTFALFVNNNYCGEILKENAKRLLFNPITENQIKLYLLMR